MHQKLLRQLHLWELPRYEALHELSVDQASDSLRWEAQTHSDEQPELMCTQRGTQVPVVYDVSYNGEHYTGTLCKHLLQLALSVCEMHRCENFPAQRSLEGRPVCIGTSRAPKNQGPGCMHLKPCLNTALKCSASSIWAAGRSDAHREGRLQLLQGSHPLQPLRLELLHGGEALRAVPRHGQ